MKKWYWLSTKKMTFDVYVEDGIISDSAPIVRKFIGQPIDNLKMKEYRIFKIGIVGSRRRNTQEDKDKIRKALVFLLGEGKLLHLVSGGCPKGADKFAEELAEELKLSISIHYPDKEKLPSNPEYYHYVQMYYDRNTLIAEECDVLLALAADDRRGGTEDTIKKVENLGKMAVLL